MVLKVARVEPRKASIDEMQIRRSGRSLFWFYASRAVITYTQIKLKNSDVKNEIKIKITTYYYKFILNYNKFLKDYQKQRKSS